jgi:hypothetical protein
MNPYGWFFMVLSFGSITGLLVFCLVRTVRSGRKDLSAPDQNK